MHETAPAPAASRGTSRSFLPSIRSRSTQPSSSSLFFRLEEDPTNRALALLNLDADVGSARAHIRSTLEEYYHIKSPSANNALQGLTSEDCLVRLEGLRKALLDVCVSVPTVAAVLRPVTQEYEIIIRRLITEVRRSPAVNVMEDMKGVVRELLHERTESKKQREHMDNLIGDLRAAQEECERLRMENERLSSTIQNWRETLGRLGPSTSSNADNEIDRLKTTIHEVNTLRDNVAKFYDVIAEYQAGETRRKTEIEDLHASIQGLQNEIATLTELHRKERHRNDTLQAKVDQMGVRNNDLVSQNALAVWCLTREIPLLLNKLQNTCMHDDTRKVPLFKIRKRKDGTTMNVFQQGQEENKLPPFYTTVDIATRTTVKSKGFTFADIVANIKGFWDSHQRSLDPTDISPLKTSMASDIVQYFKANGETLYSIMDGVAQYRGESSLCYEFLRIAEGTLPLTFHSYWVKKVECSLNVFLESCKALNEAALLEAIIESWLPHCCPPDRLPFVVQRTRKSPTPIVDLTDELRKQFMMFHDSSFASVEKALLKKTGVFSHSHPLTQADVLEALGTVCGMLPPTSHTSLLLSGVETAFRRLAERNESTTVANLVGEMESILFFVPETKMCGTWGFM